MIVHAFQYANMLSSLPSLAALSSLPSLAVFFLAWLCLDVLFEAVGTGETGDGQISCPVATGNGRHGHARIKSRVLHVKTEYWGQGDHP